MDLRELVTNAFIQNKKAALLIGGAGVAVLGLGLGYKYLRKPEKVTRVGVVSQLLVHPLKSGKAVSVALAECQHMGLKYGELRDRHWLVITEDGHMVTGRQEPRLVLVSLTGDGGQLCLNGPDMEDLCFPLHRPDEPVVNCRVFGADIQGRDCGDEASVWLTHYLASDKTFRLVYFEPHMKPRRPVDLEPLFSQYEQVAYPDVGPVMLLSEASVRDLSSRLEKDVTVERFRPNIVVGDCEAFDEDSWEYIQIGEVRLQRVMSCGSLRHSQPSDPPRIPRRNWSGWLCAGMADILPRRLLLSSIMERDPVAPLPPSDGCPPGLGPWTPTLLPLHQISGCVFTTVDPETGVISRKEPLETLKSYRQCQPEEKHIYKTSPLFGQLYTVKKTGILQVGDVVYMISR